MKALQLLNLTLRHQTASRGWHLCNMNSHIRLPRYKSAACYFHDGIRGTRTIVPEVYKNMKFKSVYHFPYIRLVAILSRMKLYQTAVTVTAVPIVSVMYAFGFMSQKAVTVSIGIATFAGLMLYVMTQLFRRFTGIIAISEDGTVVRFSHLTFWGKRTDVYVPTENVVPLSDYCINAKDIYIPLKTYDSNDVLYMSFALGKVLDKDSFQKVFGDISYLK